MWNRLQPHFRLTAMAMALAGMGASQADAPEGSALQGLTPYEFELFRLGREDFLSVETPDDGLGPNFNGTSCGQCHSIPAIGGTSTVLEVRAGRRDPDGTFVAPTGGTLRHLFSIPPHNCQGQVPEDVNVIARRISIPLFGAGLVEAIPDSTLLALADPDDRDGDGVRGHAAMVLDVATGATRVGRFGWKAQQATLLAFAGDAYLNEMGITNDLFPNEVSADGDLVKLHLCDPAPDPEDVRDPSTGLRGIDNFANFMKFLAPPTRGPITDKARWGEEVFRELGCIRCHIPELRTGPSANPLFDRRPVPLYSDLLLHDVGTGDGIEQAAANGAEIRTPALWGLRFRRPLLHDGAAATLDQAIERHHGEAERASQAFLTLPTDKREYLLAFLKSL